MDYSKTSPERIGTANGGSQPTMPHQVSSLRIPSEIPSGGSALQPTVQHSRPRCMPRLIDFFYLDICSQRQSGGAHELPCHADSILRPPSQWERQTKTLVDSARMAQTLSSQQRVIAHTNVSDSGAPLESFRLALTLHILFLGARYCCIARKAEGLILGWEQVMAFGTQRATAEIASNDNRSLSALHALRPDGAGWQFGGSLTCSRGWWQVVFVGAGEEHPGRAEPEAAG
jgi:hypothetical protein